MNIRVNDFRWEPGKNDAEYIKLLESSRDEWQKIAQKAIAKLEVLSRAQEPRVLTLEEIREKKELSCWLEWRYGDFYAALLSVTDDTKVDYVKFWTACAFMQSEYGITVRCWNKRPTDKQRKAAKWDG